MSVPSLVSSSPAWPTNWKELRQDVDSNGGVRTYRMEVLRDISGFRKLGVHVREQILSELLKVDLLPQSPASGELPLYQEEPVRVFALGGPVGKIIDAAQTPGDDQDQVLRDAASGGSDAEEVLIKVRDLIRASW